MTTTVALDVRPLTETHPEVVVLDSAKGEKADVWLTDVMIGDASVGEPARYLPFAQQPGATSSAVQKEGRVPAKVDDRTNSI